ncbi:molybdenum cofactor guanylyltransferase [Subtercola boreus]|uniref:MobA-like NTP transferase domain-containing protein n=1 Tax=Subtercola boreus TaxID=120213 RepID=A0A3E0W8D1_9MICO|nr:NTP transferase domain-containing protein [Subtercola boreus]RFA19081.1 hypothetical protein B7R24_13205 [Subtercola boreus]RFA19219.1 hypothetical protein B7R23_13185 [Subtercola boreus]RFA25681.1 hypothetical protein B7R25_13305 [Subtercola boreus]
MIFDAIVLAGGRSSRLSGVPKALLVYDGRTLLERSLDAVQDARRRVIVGDAAVCGSALGGSALGGRAPLFAREEPPFAGPAAGIAAGYAALQGDAGAAAGGARGAADASAAPSDFVLVLACDMPRVAFAVTALLAARAGWDAGSAGGMVSADGGVAGEDGVVARSVDGRRQILAALYRTHSLGEAIEPHRRAGRLAGLSVRALLETLDTQFVTVPEGSTDDIDTPDDAARFGIGLP